MMTKSQYYNRNTLIKDRSVHLWTNFYPVRIAASCSVCGDCLGCDGLAISLSFVNTCAVYRCGLIWLQSIMDTRKDGTSRAATTCITEEGNPGQILGVPSQYIPGGFWQKIRALFYSKSTTDLPLKHLRQRSSCACLEYPFHRVSRVPGLASRLSDAFSVELVVWARSNRGNPEAVGGWRLHGQAAGHGLLWRLLGGHRRILHTSLDIVHKTQNPCSHDII